MSSIERAKSFMQRRARVIALTAVPLASLIAVTAPAAKAGLILNIGGGCSELSQGGSSGSLGTCTLTQLSAGSSLTGIQMTGTGSAFDDLVSSPGLSDSFRIFSGSTNGGGLSGVVVTVPYSFTITDTGASGATLVWNLIVQANGETVLSSLENPTSPGTTSGSMSTTSLTVPAVTSYGLFFTVEDLTPAEGETLTATIPVSINSVGASGVPEPGTFALLGFALATLGSLAWWRKRATS